MVFILFFLLSLVAWWALSWKIRQALYSEWSGEEQETGKLILGALKQQLRTVSPQNAIAQGLVDFELKSKNLKAALMMISFHRLGVIALGLILAATLESKIFIGMLLIATLLLMMAFKNPTKWIQVFLLAATFFGLYQGVFFKANTFIFSESGQSIGFFLADGRFFQLLILGALSILVTLLLRLEFWSLLLASLLFFSGAMPIQNAAALIIGEAIAWSFFWWNLARHSSRVSGILFREKMILILISALIFMGLLLNMKGLGWLDIRVMGPLESKKFLFLFVWAFWEVFISLILSLWGHFRSKSKLDQTTELSPIQCPAALLGGKWWGYKGWISEQVQNRRDLIQKRIQKLESQLQALSEEEKKRFPLGFLDKTHQEVESLKSLLGALPSNSV